jgi:ATP-binding cassette subfamily F protein uup
LLVSHDRDFLDRVAGSVLMAEGEGKFVEYAGGYSDMLAQRGYGVEAPSAQQSKSKKTSLSKERNKSNAPLRKLSFKDKHVLETLPSIIVEHEKEIAALHEVLADGECYVRDPKAFAATTEKLRQVQEALSAAEERWLELETLREELERQ